MNHRCLQPIGMCVLVTGLVLACAGGLISNQVIEACVLGPYARSLGWGTTLFRFLLVFHGLALVVGSLLWQRYHLQPTQRERLKKVDPQRPAKLETIEILTVVILLGLAFIMRIWKLDSCLWIDEILTLVRYARPPISEIVTSFPDQNQHMFYSVLAHWSVAVFGESAWAVRLPAVMFGVLSIWALFYLGKTVTSRRESFLAAALMTVSYHHLWFSQNARGYTGLLFFTLCSTALFIRGLRENRWAHWLGYAIACSLGLWVHLTMVFVVFSHSLVFGWRVLMSWKCHNICELKATTWRPFIAFLLVATLTGQLYAFVLPEFFSSALHEVSLPSEWTSLLWVVRETLNGLSIGFSGGIGVLVGTGLLVLGLLSLARCDRTILPLFILPGLIGAAAMLVMRHNLWPRFFFFCMGFAVLAIVRGGFACGELLVRLSCNAAHRQVWQARCGTLLILLMAVMSMATLPRCYLLPKQDYLGARDFVQENRKPDDSIVAVGLAAFSFGDYYAPSWTRPSTVAELVAAQSTSGATWLVYTSPTHLATYCPDIYQTVQRDFEVVRIFPGTLGAGEIYVCRSRDRRSTSTKR